MHARAGTIGGTTLAYLVQHGEKEPLPGDPGLTGTGREQATCTGRWLCDLGMRALFSSPMRRARETAEGIASVTGLEVRPDARLRERLNWDGSLPFDALLASWARTMRDRDWVPPDGESSRQAGARLREFLAGLAGTRGPVAVVTHGGITVDLLRNLLGDDGVPPPVLASSWASCSTGRGARHGLDRPARLTGEVRAQLPTVISTASTVLLDGQTYQGFGGFWPAVAATRTRTRGTGCSPGG
jgi:broad specificity phosphatase PhoE